MHVLVLSSYVLLGLLTFLFVTERIQQPAETSVKELTWTEVYKINGQMIRGFAVSEHGQKWYVKWRLRTEEDKVYFSSFSLAGSRFAVDAYPAVVAPYAHQYAFQMYDYIKSNGAMGQLEVENYTYLDKNQSFRTIMAEQRFRLKEQIRNTFPTTIQAEAEALLIGSREEMDEELQAAYQTLGITHLFAISGLHVALMVMLFYETLLRVGVRKEMASVFLIVALPLYAFIAGGAPSVWRAVSVSLIILISVRARKKIPIEDAFALSVIGFVLVTPWVIFQIGFQLSYLAAFALIFSSKILQSQSSYIAQSFLVTFLCQLIVYPLLLFHFYEISLSSFLANLLFVPLFSFIILPFNILLLFLSFISPMVTNFFLFLYEPLRVFLQDCILFLGNLPYQMWNPFKPSISFVLLAYIGLLTFLVSFEQKKKWLKAFCILFIPIFLIQLTPYFDSSTKITFLNVGQGDCIVIELPHRKKTVMIDTGGLLRFQNEELWKKSKKEYKVGEQVVVPFLKGRGIHQLDVLVLTHADADHMEGADEILRAVKVKEIHISPGSFEEDSMNELRETASRYQVPIVEKMAGDILEIDPFIFTYLYPRDRNYEGNNDSLILSMYNPNFHALFLGDLEREGELQLLELYGESLKGITLMKLGHHGSKTSSDQVFLELTKPALAIITAGFQNRYGHPHKEVTDRLDKLEIPYLQTGQVGAIEVRITKEGKVTYFFH